jgi:branched-chain amino acid transport system ATP-binding protein
MSGQKAIEGGQDPILQVESVTKAFGGVIASRAVSFSIEKQIITGLIGPNGAGKTTLFNLMTGIYAPDQGRIVFNGEDIRGQKPHALVGRGIARTFQNVELFGNMTALENIMIGRHVRTRCGFWDAILRLPRAAREERGIRSRAHDILDFVGLQDAADARSGDLPFGWQRLLEIGRALACEPQLLLLDEPAAGLNAVETHQLATLIRQISQQGITIVLVEHDMSLTMSICDFIVVIDQGAKIAEGQPRYIQSHPAVMAAYLGTETAYA